MIKLFLRNFGRIAQLGEHLPYKQGVIGSSPIAPTNPAGVAQPVEQLICNQQVGGSNPSTSSKTTLVSQGCFYLRLVAV